MPLLGMWTLLELAASTACLLLQRRATKMWTVNGILLRGVPAAWSVEGALRLALSFASNLQEFMWMTATVIQASLRLVKTATLKHVLPITGGLHRGPVALLSVVGELRLASTHATPTAL